MREDFYSARYYSRLEIDPLAVEPEVTVPAPALPRIFTRHLFMVVAFYAAIGIIFFTSSQSYAAPAAAPAEHGDCIYGYGYDD